MQYIDLTQRIFHDMPRYPGDPAPGVEEFASYKQHGFAASKLEISLHTGTHIDAPYHMVETARKLFDYPLDHFIGNAILVDAVGVRNIDEQILENALISNGDILLIRTDHSHLFRDPAYYTSYPSLTESLAKQLCENGIRILGLDSPSPDYDPFPVHKKLFENDILIIENLCNLDRLPAGVHFKLFAIPLNVCAEAAPARVFAQF